MRNLLILLTTGLLTGAIAGTAWAAPDCSDPKHADKPVCADDGGDDGGSGGIATNDISVQWDGAVDYTGPAPSGRNCTLDSEPKPNGTHTAYTCVQEPAHSVRVSLSNGQVLDSKGGAPSAEDSATCITGFSFDAYPNTQYIAAVGGGEVCNDADGCPLTVLNAIHGQDYATGYRHVKLQGTGRVAPSENPNPFACPAAGAPVTTQTIGIDSVDVGVRDGNGSKADLVCRFDVAGTTSFQVTPVCP